MKTIHARESTEYRQQQIVEAARKIVASRGMEVLTIREIAKEVGVSDGDIYRHFASKRDILFLLIKDIENTLFDMFDQAVSEKQEPLERLENVLKSHLSYSEQRRGISLIVIAEALRLADKDIRKGMFEVVYQYIGRIRELLAQAVKTGAVSKNVDLDMAALIFFSLVYTTVTLWALSNHDFSLAKRHKPLWESYLLAVAAN